MQKHLFAMLLVSALAVESFGDTTVIKSIINRRTDLATYCTDGVSPDFLDFQDSSGPFYASRDLTIPGMRDNWRDVTIELDSGRVITLNGNMYCMTGGFLCKGGVYDFQNSYGLGTGGWNEYVQRGVGMTLDGAVFTNMPCAVLQNNGQAGGTWTLRNGARIHTAGVFQMAAYGTPAPGLLVDLTSGAQVVCGSLDTDGNKAAERADVTRVLRLSGEGTRLSSTGTADSRIGWGYSGVEVRVADHADLTLAGTTHIGLEWYSWSNALRLSDAATAQLGVVYLGCNGGGSNVVEVVDEATLTTGTFFLNGGSSSTRDNLVVVSNATIVAQRFFSVWNKGSGATVRLAGDHPQIQVNAGTRQPDSTAAEFKNDMTLAFDLPVDGYRDGLVPLTVTGTLLKNDAEQPIGTYSDGTLKIRFAGVEAMQARMLKTRVAKRTITLIRCRGGIDYPAAVMEDANAQLPAGARLYKTQVDGSNVLVLEVTVDLGTMILVR